MDPAMEEQYIQMAGEHPGMLGSEVPKEVLEAASGVDHPTQFLTDFIETGHNQWLLQEYGQLIPRNQDFKDKAVLVLWLKASHLHTSHLLGRPDPQWDKPFFSDEGIYD